MMDRVRRLTKLTGIAVIPAVMMAGGAVALEPPAYVCPGDAIGTPYEIRDYTISLPGDDERFVFYNGTEAVTGNAAIVLEDCELREQILVRVRTGSMLEQDDLEVSSAFSQMAFGPEPLTMAQIAARLRDIGGEPEHRRVNYVSCACATGGY